MTTVAELREALEELVGEAMPIVNPSVALAIDAAHLWLRILEGDEQLVETIKSALRSGLAGKRLTDSLDKIYIPEAVAVLVDTIARAVLAALTEEDEK